MAASREALSALNLRVPRAMIQRAEDLREAVTGAPEMSILPSVSRSDVLRLALLRGLEALEAQYEAQSDEGLGIVMTERMKDPKNRKGKPLDQFLGERGL